MQMKNLLPPVVLRMFDDFLFTCQPWKMFTYFDNFGQYVSKWMSITHPEKLIHNYPWSTWDPRMYFGLSPLPSNSQEGIPINLHLLLLILGRGTAQDKLQ